MTMIIGRKTFNLLILLFLLISSGHYQILVAEELPLPLKGYHERNEPITENWSKAGSGYMDPYTYKPKTSYFI